MTGTELRRGVIREMERLVCSDRQDVYGDAEDNFLDIATLLNVVLGPKLRAKLTSEDVALVSVCIKLSRIKSSPDHIDSWIDLGGYAVCGAGIVKRKS